MWRTTLNSGSTTFPYFWLFMGLLLLHMPKAVNSSDDGQDFDDTPYDETDELGSTANLTDTQSTDDDMRQDDPELDTGLDNETNTRNTSSFGYEKVQTDLQLVEPENVSFILQKIFKNYVKQERPYYRVKPTDIQIRFDIRSISHISEENMEFRASVYFKQSWWDPRLEYNPGDKKSYVLLRQEDIFKIWLPDTYISNARSYTVDPYTPTVRIFGDGLVDYSCLISLTLLSRMDFLYYPMDHQQLHIDIFTYTHASNQVLLSWDRGSMLLKEIPTFVVKKVKKIEDEGEYSSLSFRIIVRRRLRYFLLQFFFPCILCALVSCLPFWMDRYEIGERLALGITTLLTEVFLSQYINSSIPRVSYIKAADEYLLATFMFIFFALLESVVVYNYRPDVLERKRQEKKDRKKTKKPAMNGNLGSPNVTAMDEINEVEMNFYGVSGDTSGDTTQGENEQTTTSPVRQEEEATVISPSKDLSIVIDKCCRILFPFMIVVFQAYYFGRYLPDFYRAYT